MSLPPIKLHCTKCGRKMDYERGIDADIPDCVVRIESAPCDECDNGDFGSETWYDAADCEVQGCVRNLRVVCPGGERDECCLNRDD